MKSFNFWSHRLMDMSSWHTFCDHVTPRFKAARGWLLEFHKFLGGDHWRRCKQLRTSFGVLHEGSLKDFTKNNSFFYHWCILNSQWSPCKDKRRSLQGSQEHRIHNLCITVVLLKLLCHVGRTFEKRIYLYNQMNWAVFKRKLTISPSHILLR